MLINALADNRVLEKFNQYSTCKVHQPKKTFPLNSTNKNQCDDKSYRKMVHHDAVLSTSHKYESPKTPTHNPGSVSKRLESNIPVLETVTKPVSSPSSTNIKGASGTPEQFTKICEKKQLIVSHKHTGI